MVVVEAGGEAAGEEEREEEGGEEEEEEEAAHRIEEAEGLENSATTTLELVTILFLPSYTLSYICTHTTLVSLPRGQCCGAISNLAIHASTLVQYRFVGSSLLWCQAWW